MNKKTITKYACFFTGGSTSIPSALPPLLFLSFHNFYDISYTLLGFLIVLNFGTQLLFDLTYSFFSRKFNLKLSLKLTPFVMFCGLLIFALAPQLFKDNVFAGLAIGTVVFSAGCGLSEVLTSPAVAALPSKEPEKLMSKLHSFYAWGVLIVVSVSTAFFKIFGNEYWQVLTLILSLFPLFTFILMLLSDLPELKTEETNKGIKGVFSNKTVWYFVLCIFFSGAAEVTMSSWSSAYLENAFGIDKTLGDLLGVALFGGFLAFGRTLYSKKGGNIDRVLLFGSVGALCCYIAAVVSLSQYVGLIACMITGFFVSMLWPGSLIAVTDRVKDGGVSLFALMAMGGDLGSTLFPQAVGFITDTVSENEKLLEFGKLLGLTGEQLGMKAGMLFAVIGPLCASIMFFISYKKRKAA